MHAVLCVVEAVSFAAYVYTEEAAQTDEANYSSTAGDTPRTFFAGISVFAVQVGCSVALTLFWFLRLVLLEEYKLPFVLSFTTLIQCGTCFPMIILGLGAVAGGGEQWGSIWMPMFLRIWGIHEHLIALLDNPMIAFRLEDQHHDILRHVIDLVATMVTCAGCFQAAETFSNGGTTVQFFEALYYMVVTFATIGFGDYFPTVTLSRLVVVVIIVVALYTFPLFFAKLAELADDAPSYSTFRAPSSRTNGHVQYILVVGSLTHRDIQHFLRECFIGSRRFLDLNVVIMTDLTIAQKTRFLAALPIYRDRVTLVAGDCAKGQDLIRCDASRADAIFVLSSSEAASAFTDFHVVERVMSLSHHCPSIPLYVLLKRERHAAFVCPVASVVLEKDRLRCSLLGMAVMLPGVIPLMVNLARSHEPGHGTATAREGRSWRDKYEWAMAQELCSVPLSSQAIAILESMTFLEFVSGITRLVVQAVPKTVGSPEGDSLVIPIGVVRSSGRVDLFPRPKQGTAWAEVTKLIVVSESQVVANRVLTKFFESCDVNVTALRNSVLRNTTSRAISSLGRQHVSNDIGRNVLGHGERLSSRQPVYSQLSELSAFSDHVVVVDLAPARIAHQYSSEAEEDVAHMRAVDLMNVITPIVAQRPSAAIALLSLTAPTPHFIKRWKAVQRAYSSSTDDGPRLLFVQGCGLSFADLRKCNVAAASGVIIFASEERHDPNADAMALLATMSVESITQPCLLDQPCGAEPLKGSGAPSTASSLPLPRYIPIVVDVTEIDSAGLFTPPVVGSSIIEGCRHRAETNFAWDLNIVTGKVISSSMLDALLLQSFITKELIPVVEAMVCTTESSECRLRAISIGEIQSECAKHTSFSNTLKTYADVVEASINFCDAIPLGLHRILDDVACRINVDQLQQPRFMHTNPPPETEIRSDDLVYVLVSPAISTVSHLQQRERSSLLRRTLSVPSMT